ncbi:MAG: hypothetical protein ABIU63_08355 [Chitinophagaceae bacterium]
MTLGNDWLIFVFQDLNRSVTRSAAEEVAAGVDLARKRVIVAGSGFAIGVPTALTVVAHGAAVA